MSKYKPTGKARFWQHILYPENMVDDWRDRIADDIQVPFAYCVHDKDASGHDGDRKKHVHLITAWTSGSQTMRRAWETVEVLAKDGRVCSLQPRPCAVIERAYAYLIHDTESAKKAGKHLYDVSERVTGNTFDIDRYIVLDTDAKLAMGKELTQFVENRKYKDFASAYYGIMTHFDDRYYEILKANNAFIDRLCRGNYLRFRAKADVYKTATCCVCGSQDVIGSFRDPGTGGLMWTCAAHQQTAFVICDEWEEYQKDMADEREVGTDATADET